MTSSAVAEKTTLRSTTIDRQKREREFLFNLYRLMPQKTEYRFMRASRIAETVGASTSFVDAAIRTFEMCGIISRRLEFGAVKEGKVVTGRSYHWTLIPTLNDAVDILDAYHANQKEIPHGSTASLKVRIMDALNIHKTFHTMDDLTKAIVMPGENLDRHNITHVLMVLVKEGRVTLNRGTTKDRIPYNISLSKSSERSLLQAIDEEIIIAQPEEVEEPTFDIPVNMGEKFPIIRRLVKRRAWLEEAAKLAEDAAEEDLAITLLERSNKPMSPLETEAVDMFFELFAIYEKSNA